MAATTPRARSVSSFIWILILAVMGTGIFAGAAGYAMGANDLAGQFSVDQVQFIDGLMYGVQLKAEREQWLVAYEKKEAAKDDFRSFPGQRCAGKFFPDHPVEMKGCLAAQEPRPPEGYQYSNE